VNRVAFYGGVVLIVIGVVYWILRPSSPAQKNAIKLPGGFEFELNTPAFALVVLGIVLMLISQQFPEWVGPKPPPQTQDFDVSGPVATFGCQENATAKVTYNAPPGWTIISATPHVGADSGDVKDQNARITNQDERHIEVEATFRGRDRNFGIDCPSGGHGQAQVTGKIQKD
jgi:hypothetical protein